MIWTVGAKTMMKINEKGRLSKKLFCVGFDEYSLSKLSTYHQKYLASAEVGDQYGSG